ncbi:hypothetical protein B0H14DRAFT_2823413, partial [Mycena olivaceomarginata]
MSGNGMKGKGYTELATAMNTEFRTVRSVQRRMWKVASHMYKDHIPESEFIRGKTGAGWTILESVLTMRIQCTLIALFAVCAFIVVPSPSIHLLQQYGDKYKAYFGKPFIYYDCASKLFGRNSATGNNVYHPKKLARSLSKSTDNPAKPSTK